MVPSTTYTHTVSAVGSRRGNSIVHMYYLCCERRLTPSSMLCITLVDSQFGYMHVALIYNYLCTLYDQFLQYKIIHTHTGSLVSNVLACL